MEPDAFLQALLKLAPDLRAAEPPTLPPEARPAQADAGGPRGGGPPPAPGPAPKAIPEEAFRQRLLLLAARNEEPTQGPGLAAASRAAASEGPAAPPLEGMLGDLLAALHKEQPGDPLSREEAAALVEADAVAAGEGPAAPPLEGMLGDLLAALHKEQPGDPLSREEAAALGGAGAAAAALPQGAPPAGWCGGEPGSCAASIEPLRLQEASAASGGGGLAAAVAAAAAVLREGQAPRDRAPLGEASGPSAAGSACPSGRG
ncbi:unnamed protein product [Prorocentrum cordatum]|uniref:Uncharacterized protein n=1 Tax=Prorocentrum cordatum TaxID=2364126 RepID=A0ABN9Q7X6_9DINO|nr:unnamed protein product [Polarella glacialis]